MSLLNKYKKRGAVKVSNLKKQKEKDDENAGFGSGNEYLNLEDGKTCKFRFLPPHDEEETAFTKMRKRYWITIDVDGEEKRRTVLDSRLHGGTAKDIINEYVNFVKKHHKDKADFISDWKTGLNADISWLAYAVKLNKDERKFGLLEIKKTVRDVINKEIFTEDDDEPIEVDPFTHVTEGLPVLIKYLSKPNKKKGEDYYSVTVGKKAAPLTEEDLIEFEKSKSLNELYDNVYGLRDFELALEGLRHYDETNGIDVFEDDRWLEIVEEVKAQYDEEDTDDEDEKPAKKSSKKPAKKSSKKVEEEEEEEEDDDDEEEEDEDDDEDDEDDEEDEDEDEDDEEDEDEDEDDEEDEDEDEEEEEKPAKKTSKKEEPKKSSKTLDDIRAKLNKNRK